jgi:hypothetical protein
MIQSYSTYIFSKEKRKTGKKKKESHWNRRVRRGVKVFAIFFDT